MSIIFCIILKNLCTSKNLCTMKNKRNSFIDLQIRLAETLADRNIESFRAAFALATKPITFTKDCMRIFERALQTAGCVEFVEEFLKAGCDPNYVISNDKLGLDFIKPGVEVFTMLNKMTPLNYLAKYLKQENKDDAFKCIQILLQYSASPNIADNKGMTPLQYIVNNQELDDLEKVGFVQLLLSWSDVNIDVPQMGELRIILEDKYPDLILPENEESWTVTFDTLLTDIRNNDMLKFKQNYMHYSGYITESENHILILESIRLCANLAFDLLLKNVAHEYIKRYNDAITMACLNGNWHALKKFLEIPDMEHNQRDLLLSWVVKKLDTKSLNEFCDYWKCFYILLECDKIYIDKLDALGYTALHYAVKYRNNSAVKELLKRGANICVESYEDELLIDGMDVKILEEHFNNCITTNDAKVGDKNFQIIVDFKNLIPRKDSNLQIIAKMPPIVFMAENKDYRHLLQHPVITSYLFLKWHKLSLAFYINLILYLFYALSIITLVVFKFKEKDYEKATAVFVMLSWLGIGYLVVREILQFFMFPLRYLSWFSNYVEILLITLSIMTCLDLKSFDIETQRIIAILTILLSAAELYLLVGSLPVSTISTHMLMLEAVCKSFFKSFLLYSIFVITFTICFYIMHDSENGERFNNFPNLLLGFSKTIVMLTGELDAANLKLNTYYSQLIFLLFVFFMTIILFNLLNGLAVSDTQTIKDQADLNYIICLTQLLARYERHTIELTKHLINLEYRIGCYHICCCYANVYKCVIDIFKYFRNLCPDFSSHQKIAILPNDNNTIVIPKLKSPNRPINTVNMRKYYAKTSEQYTPTANDDSDDQNSSCFTCGIFQCKEVDNRNIKLAMDVLEADEDVDVGVLKENQKTCCFTFITGSCSQMDKRIVKSAMDVLERKSQESNDERLQNIETKLEQMIAIMQRLEHLN